MMGRFQLVVAFCLAFIVALSTLSLFARNSIKVDFDKTDGSTYELKGWRPFLVNVLVTYKPEGLGNSDTAFRIDTTAGHTVADLDRIKPFKKYTPHFLLMSEREITLVHDGQKQGAFDLRIKYLDGRLLFALLSASLAIFVFSFFCFRAHPLSYLTWGVAYISLVLYVGQVGGGFAQYALCSALLLLAHLVWFNSKLRFYHALSTLLFLSIYPILALSVYHYAVSGRIQDSEIVAVLQTNFQEALDYISDFVGWGVVFLVGASILISSYLFSYAYSRRVLAHRKFNVIALVPILILIVGFGFQPSEYLGLKEFLQAKQEYLEEIKRWQAQKSTRKIAGIANTENKIEQDEITVLVIGESLSRHHSSLYNYQRETSPMLAATPRLLVFTDAVSNHTQTLPSVTHMITNSYNDQPRNFSQASSLINVANSAGINTSWLSNQTRLGWSNNWVSILASEADTTFFVNETSVGTGRNLSVSYDDLLLPSFRKTLAEKSGSKLIILHLFGSHSTYSKRYPMDFSKFSGREALKIREHQLPSNETINSYDNSVLYNDYIVEQLISTLGSQNCTCTLIYSPDHGEDLVHGRAHDAVHYDPLMVEIPFLIWTPDTWEGRYPKRQGALQSHLNASFMNDNIYDTIIGLMNVTTKTYQNDRDLSSTGYRERERITLHGKRPYSN